MIDCKKIANEIKQELKQELNKVSENPHLAIIQVGDNPASNRYVKGKIADCEEVGIKPTLFKMDENIREDQIIDLIKDLNNNNGVHGIIVQLPLPPHLDEEKITHAIIPQKDVDGFVPGSPFTPCTPLGVLTLLDKMGVDVKGKMITLVGYGKLVNKPLFPILSDMGATIAVCRSNTDSVIREQLLWMSDIVITAVGKHGLIRSFDLGYRTIVIDCGIEIIDGKQYGDCDENVYRLCFNTTPRVGGMGLMTRVCLLKNVIEAYKKWN